ncbi:MAG TPA: MFS transporter [Stellaceae bacterium]|jgi:EmrB/QacA subfamily drug resistance transporter
MPAETTKDELSAAPGIMAERRVLIFIAALATVFITQIESTIVATAMPTIVAALGGFELLSWVFTVYLLTQAVTTPIYGRLADLYGRKPVLLVGIALFLIGSVACGLAWNMTSLVIFRAIQGFGAGAISPVSRTLIGDVYHGADRARMQGYVSGVFVGAAILGPVVGAFLVAHTIWQMVFWINLPIGLIAAAILIWALKEHVTRRRARIDIGGSALLALGTLILMYALAQSAALPGAWFAALIVIAVAVLALFGLYELRVAEPIWPMSLWRDRMSTSGNLVSFSLGVTMMGIAAYLPVYIQGVMGESAMTAGLVIMSMSATSPIGAVLAGQIMLRSSYRLAASIGGVVYIAGTVMMLMLDAQSGPSWAVISGLLIGFGLGLNNNTYMVAIQAECGWSNRGLATGVFIFARILGQALGAAAFGGILNAGLARYLNGEGDILTRILTPEQRASLPPGTLAPLMQAFSHSLHVIFIVLVALAVATLLIGLMLPKGRSIRR